MTTSEFAEIISKLVLSDIEVTIKIIQGKVVHDLNTSMKSHLYLQYDTETQVCKAYGRYDMEDIVYEYRDVLWLVKGCLHGRDFGNRNWIELLVKEGVLKVIEEVKVQRSYK